MENRERDSGQQGRMKIRQAVLKGKKPERLERSVPEIILQHVFFCIFRGDPPTLRAPFPPLMVPFSFLLGTTLCFLLPPFQCHEKKTSPEPLLPSARAVSGL